MRKRWGFDASVDAFVYHLDVGAFVHHPDVGAFVYHASVGAFVYHLDVGGSTAINGGAYAIHGCVVLPAH